MAINGSPVRRPGPPGPDPAWAWIGPALAGLVALASLGLITPLLLWYSVIRLRNPASFLCALTASALLVTLAVIDTGSGLNLPVFLTLWLGGAGATVHLFRSLAVRPAVAGGRHGGPGTRAAAPGTARPGPADHRR